MADEKILKPKSFRIDDETADRFKEIANEIGGNQQETLAKLIQAYEFQAGKAILTERKADIEQFENYVNALTRMFMGSLEDNQNITETVKTEFDALLKSKDTTIQDLQAQLADAKHVKEITMTKAAEYSNLNEQLNNHIAALKQEMDQKADNYELMLKDKDELNKALMNSCNDLKDKVDSMEKEHEEINTLRKNISDVTAERDTLKNDNAAYKKALDDNKLEYDKKIEELKQHELDALSQCNAQNKIELDKAVLETERKYQEQLQQLKEQKQSEVDKYQQKYFDLMEKLQAAEKAASDAQAALDAMKTNVENPKKK